MGSAEIKTGWRFAGIEKNEGGHLHGAWTIVLTRPKMGVGTYPRVGTYLG